MAREKPAGVGLDFRGLQVSGALSGSNKPLAGGSDGKGARRGFGGELPDGFESAGFGRNAKAGNAVVAAIRGVEEAPVGGDFQVSARVGLVKIFREGGQGLPKADLARVAIEIEDAHAAALFVVEIEAVQLRMELEMSGAGSSFGADEWRQCRRQSPVFCVEGENVDCIGAGVGDKSPLIVTMNQNRMGFCGGGMPVNGFGEKGSPRLNSVDADFPSAVISREQKRFGAIQGKVGGIRSCGDDGDELESACFGINFVAGNLPGGSIGGKESGAAAVRRKESGLGWSRALPGQDKRS